MRYQKKQATFHLLPSSRFLIWRSLYLYCTIYKAHISRFAANVPVLPAFAGQCVMPHELVEYKHMTTLKGRGFQVWCYKVTCWVPSQQVFEHLYVPFISTFIKLFTLCSLCSSHSPCQHVIWSYCVRACLCSSLRVRDTGSCSSACTAWG